MAKRRVFLSWSGVRSKYLATKLREWLPRVIQQLHPWMSDEDIPRGAGWLTELQRELKENHYGILCVTPENQGEPWLNFEAGALSKQLDAARVCPYLVGLKKSDLRGPLATLQASEDTPEDTWKLLLSMNAVLAEDAVPEQTLRAVFERMWPDWEHDLRAAPLVGEPRPARSDREILEEILGVVRRIEHDQADPMRGAADFFRSAKHLRDPDWVSRNPISALLAGHNHPAGPPPPPMTDARAKEMLQEMALRAIGARPIGDDEPDG